MRQLTNQELKLPSFILAILLIAVCWPLYSAIHMWVFILAGSATSVSIARSLKPFPALPQRTLNLFAVLCLGLLMYFANQHGLLATMVNLLIVAGCLKLFTLKTTADVQLVLVVMIFLVACGFIFHQSIPMAIYFLLVIFLILYVALILNTGKLPQAKQVKLTGIMLLQALPITAAIFLIAPRLPPFWQAPVEQNTQTGLAEKITPGDIANLAQSTELVFRAEFENEVPPAAERYFRAVVLDQFDGKTWSISQNENLFTPVLNSDLINELTPEIANEKYTYLVIAEPTNTPYLYTLDIPVLDSVMSGVPLSINNRYQLFGETINQLPSLYIATSFTKAPLLNKNDRNDSLQRYLQIPSEGNQRTRDYISSLEFGDKTTLEIVQLLSSQFVEESFSYTLQPPLMLEDSVDQFLFDYQVGFCSHYASAMTYMLRLAGIPSRMVAGYQGGEVQAGNILTVRQLDAHAWIEAYDEKVGWIRFDPTALVAPDRAIAGLLSSLNAEDSSLIQDESFVSGLFDLPVFSQLNDLAVIVNHNWQQFVLEYDKDSQRSLLQQLFGKSDAKSLITFMLAVFGTIILFIAAVFVPWKKLLTPPNVSTEKLFLTLLEKQGFHRQKKETLLQFCERISPELQQHQAQAINGFVDAYYDQHYAGKDISDELNVAFNSCTLAFSKAEQTS